jgi:hypothetical protein
MMNYRVERPTAVPRSACPDCGAVSNRPASYAANARPEPGDPTLCFACGALVVFADDLRLRLPTGAELIQLQSDPTVWRLIEAASAALIEKRRATEKGFYG